jgi:transaldolase
VPHLTYRLSRASDAPQLKELKPTDATTNPSLVNTAARMDEYKHLVDDAVKYAAQYKGEGDKMTVLLDKVRGRAHVD